MPELRKDYFLDRWVIIAPGRSKRPKELRKEEPSKKTCFFCPGKEQLTPAEIGRLGGKHWRMRWFPNKFPVVQETGNPFLRNRTLAHAAAYGKHEIIVETPSSTKQLWDLPSADMVKLLTIYNQRITELEKRKHIKYVLVVKNHGIMAGASLSHSHTQVASLSMLPPVVKQELIATKGNCKYCSVINLERKSARKCFENDSVIAFAPYASRFSYELWILPKKHIRKLSDFSEKELEDFAHILNTALKKLKKLDVDYNYYLHYAPSRTDLHLHVELTPRLERWAGIELSSGVSINSVSPESAAKFYRKG